MIDVAELMQDPDFAKAFVVKRPRIARAADGSVTTTYLEFEAVGIVQPAKPGDVQDLPEGTRAGDLVSVWSDQTLRGSDGNKRESDIIVSNCQSYRVVKAEPWGDNGYHRVFAEGFVP